LAICTILAATSLFAWAASYLAPRSLHLENPPGRTWAMRDGALLVASYREVEPDSWVAAPGASLPGVSVVSMCETDEAASDAWESEKRDTDMSLLPPPAIASRRVSVSLWLPLVLSLVGGAALLVEARMRYRNRRRHGRCLRCGAAVSTPDEGLCNRCGQRAAARAAQRADSDSALRPGWWLPATLVVAAMFVVFAAAFAWSYATPIQLLTGSSECRCRYDAGEDSWIVGNEAAAADWDSWKHSIFEFEGSSGPQIRCDTLVVFYGGRLRVGDLQSYVCEDVQEDRSGSDPQCWCHISPVWSASGWKSSSDVPVLHILAGLGAALLCLAAYPVLLRMHHVRQRHVRRLLVLRWLGVTATILLAIAYLATALSYKLEYGGTVGNHKYEVSIAIEAGTLRTTIVEELPSSPVLRGPPTQRVEVDRWHLWKSSEGLDAFAWWPSYVETSDAFTSTREARTPLWIPLLVVAFATGTVWWLALRPAKRDGRNGGSSVRRDAPGTPLVNEGSRE
jgi:hypothetical protein